MFILKYLDRPIGDKLIPICQQCKSLHATAIEVKMNELGILRSIADDELELMRSWRNEPAVRANMYTRHEISREEHLNWWGKTKERADQKYFM